MQKIHFISGLPRSGSTMLAGIIRQNPKFHAAMTGPVGPMVQALTNLFGPQNETAVFLDEERRRDILRSVVEAFYRPQEDRSVIFDTNRMWAARLPLIRGLFPEAKVLCCVRNLAWIMDSIECLVRRNAFEPSRLFNTQDERATVYSRTEALAHRDRLVGFAFSALKEAYYGEHASSLLLVEYDLLTQRPEECMKLIYGFLDEPWFEHDFENVEYDEPEFDRNLGAPGLHTVKGAIRYKPRKTVLPPDVFEKYKGLSFWQDPAGTSAYRITVKSPEDASSTE